MGDVMHNSDRLLFGAIVFLCAAFSFLVTASSRAYAANDNEISGREGKRIALVIGNGAYQSVGALQNPHNDANAFAKALEKVEPKFRIVTGFDVTYEKFKQIVDQFEKDLDGADVGLFYFAGHSMQMDSATGSENYLLSVNAMLDSNQVKSLADANVDEKIKSPRLNSIMERMERRVKTRLVFLDACRDNPFVQSYVKEQEANDPGKKDADAVGTQASAAPAGADRGANRLVARSLIGRGLAPVKNLSPKGGTYIAFATAPGEVALDGEKGNSPFTAALVRHVVVRGADIDQVMTLVRRDVKQETAKEHPDHVQAPWSNTSLSDRFYFWPPRAGEEAAGSAKSAGKAGAKTASQGRRAPREDQPARSERRHSSGSSGGGGGSGGGSISPSLGGGVGAGGF
jgi:uncharacterized caspase-like protein